MTGFVDVEKEYEKNKSLKKTDVKALQEWLEKQPHLPKMSELDIVLFLDSCRYSNESAKKCIDLFYTVRAHSPEFFTNRDPRKHSAEIFDVLLYVPLPRLTPNGYKLIFAQLLDMNPDKYSLPSQVKVFDMTTMLMLHQEGTYAGHIIVVDMTGFSLAHVAKLSLVHLKKFFVYLQEAMPVKLVAIHFINIPTYMDKIMMLIKPFLKKELLDMFQLHTSDLENLYKTIPKECLPSDYGGLAGTVNELNGKRKANFLANADYFLCDEKAVANESLRPGKPKDAGEVFGVEGTFKKLDID